jgi:hypothetical protein
MKTSRKSCTKYPAQAKKVRLAHILTTILAFLIQTNQAFQVTTGQYKNTLILGIQTASDVVSVETLDPPVTYTINSQEIAMDGVSRIVRLDSVPIAIDGKIIIVKTADGKTYQSSNWVYLIGGAPNSEKLGIAAAIIFMVASLSCWICGIKQFYFLIRQAQLYFFFSLVAYQRVPARLYAYSSAFSMNLFSIIPNPVKFNERSGWCQTPGHLWVQNMSCNPYNSMKNYYICLLIYILLMLFLYTTKFRSIHFWFNWAQTVDLRVALLSILPMTTASLMVSVGTYFQSDKITLGFFFVLVMFMIQICILWSTISKYWIESEESREYLRFYWFGKSAITEHTQRQRLALVAITFDHLKGFLAGIFICLIKNPWRQLGMLGLLYLFSALWLIIARPYRNNGQNFLFAASDLSLSIISGIVFLALSSAVSISTRENTMAYWSLVFLAISYACNMITYMLPILKGEERSARILPSTATVATESNEETTFKEPVQTKKEVEVSHPPVVETKKKKDLYPEESSEAIELRQFKDSMSQAGTHTSPHLRGEQTHTNLAVEPVLAFISGKLPIENLLAQKPPENQQVEGISMRIPEKKQQAPKQPPVNDVPRYPETGDSKNDNKPPQKDSLPNITKKRGVLKPITDTDFTGM